MKHKKCIFLILSFSNNLFDETFELRSFKNLFEVDWLSSTAVCCLGGTRSNPFSVLWSLSSFLAICSRSLFRRLHSSWELRIGLCASASSSSSWRRTSCGSAGSCSLTCWRARRRACPTCPSSSTGEDSGDTRTDGCCETRWYDASARSGSCKKMITKFRTLETKSSDYIFIE